jgi:Zn-dependent M16 (insulinase) family peptidase
MEMTSEREFLIRALVKDQILLLVDQQKKQIVQTDWHDIEHLKNLTQMLNSDAEDSINDSVEKKV